MTTARLSMPCGLEHEAIAGEAVELDRLGGSNAGEGRAVGLDRVAHAAHRGRHRAGEAIAICVLTGVLGAGLAGGLFDDVDGTLHALEVMARMPGAGRVHVHQLPREEGVCVILSDHRERPDDTEHLLQRATHQLSVRAAQAGALGT